MGLFEVWFEILKSINGGYSQDSSSYVMKVLIIKMAEM